MLIDSINAFDSTCLLYYIFIWKRFIPSKREDCKRELNTIIVQFIKRKTKNTEGSNRINKKTIKKRTTIKGILSLLVLSLTFLVAVGSMGVGMTNLVYISFVHTMGEKINYLYKIYCRTD